MKSAFVLCLAVLFFFSIVSATSALAQGVIVPIACDIRPCRPIPRPVPLPNVLPVKSIKLDTNIEGQVATTHVEQVFRNDTPYTLEGTYFFPLPESASISEFAIWENGKKLAGEVRSREDARRIYDEIVRRQRDPGLLEYAGKELFQASIFPIPPGSDKKLEITYTEVLKAESGTVNYRYPLGTGRNLWSGPPQDSERRVSRGMTPQSFGNVSGRIEIFGRHAIRNIYSPSHDIDVKTKGENTASITFETSSNDSDFQLFYGISDSEFGLSLLTYREPGKDGYFLIMLSPKDSLSDGELENKDIVFVIDTSGSMADEGKMDKARAALLFGIRTLRDGDRFNVVSFAGEEHLMENRLIEADPAGKRRGEDFVNKLRPSGGTNINDSLKASLLQFDESTRPKMLVFMTDGLPTVGEADIDKILASVREARSGGIRIFPFGFGYDVNTALLDKLGTDNDGVSDYVQPKEDLEIKVSNFFTRVSSPVLSDISLDFGRVDIDLLYPRKVSNLFRGSQLAIIGRYHNSQDLERASISIKGRSGKQIRNFTFGDLVFPVRDEENSFLPRLWASRRVGWLIEQIRLNGETKELRDEVTDLGTRYGIVTPYTSYLATDGSFQPVLDGMETRGGVLPPAKALKEQSGARAVQMSVQQNAMQSNVSATADKKKDATEQILIQNSRASQFVANKNFLNQSNVWVDSEYSDNKKQPEKKLQFGSADYFDLIKREPGLAPYLSLGEEVLVVWKNTVYRIVRN